MLNFTEYLNNVGEVLAKHNKKCQNDIAQANSDLDKLVQTPNGRKDIEKMFKFVVWSLLQICMVLWPFLTIWSLFKNLLKWTGPKTLWLTLVIYASYVWRDSPNIKNIAKGSIMHTIVAIFWIVKFIIRLLFSWLKIGQTRRPKKVRDIFQIQLLTHPKEVKSISILWIYLL